MRFGFGKKTNAAPPQPTPQPSNTGNSNYTKKLSNGGAYLASLKPNAPPQSPQLSPAGNAAIASVASPNNANANNNLKKNLRIYINNFNKRNQASRNSNNVSMNKNLAKSLKTWLGKRRPAAAAAAASAVLAAGGNPTQAANAAVVAGNAAKPGNTPVNVGTQTTTTLAANGTPNNLALAAGAGAAGELAPPGAQTTNAIVQTAVNGATNLANPNTPPAIVGSNAAQAALAAGASPSAAAVAGVVAQNNAALKNYNKMSVSNLVSKVNSVSTNINKNALRKAIIARKAAKNTTPLNIEKLVKALKNLSNQKKNKTPINKNYGNTGNMFGPKN